MQLALEVLGIRPGGTQIMVLAVILKLLGLLLFFIIIGKHLLVGLLIHGRLSHRRSGPAFLQADDLFFN